MRRPPDPSPWSCKKIDSYHSTKESLQNTQTHLRSLHIVTSEGGCIWANGGGRTKEGQRQERKSQSSTPSGPAHVITVKGQEATPCGQTREAEAAVQPKWPVYIEAEPRIRGWEVLQRVAVIKKSPSPLQESPSPTPTPCHPPVACLTIQLSLGKLQIGRRNFLA